MAKYSVASVDVHGLQALIRSFNRMDKSLGKELRKELKDVARIVSTEARDIALHKGLLDTGRLIRTTRPAVRGETALVRTTANNKGYQYPMIFEYGGRGETGIGPRAYLEPALQNKREDVIEALDEMLGRLASENGFGRGVL